MGTINRFEDIEAWQLAREQAKDVYKLTQAGSFIKDYDLKNQINASSGSVMDNIAEGFEKFSNKELCQSLVVSKGSNGEVRSQLYRAFDRNHISEDILVTRLEYSVMVGKKLKAFIDYLHSSSFKTKPKPKPKPKQ